MKVLVVDDDITYLDKMNKFLALENHSVNTAISVDDALSKINEEKWDLILTDLKMPEKSGLDLIRSLKEFHVQAIIMVITGYATIDSAVNAMKLGAFDYVLKPFNPEEFERKLIQVERELTLRSKITYSPLIDEMQTNSILNRDQINEFKRPFLLISDTEPSILIKKLNLKKTTSYRLEFEEKTGSIIPSKLYSLKTIVEKFIKDNKSGTIIFKGIEKLLKTHNWENVKKFLSYLQEEIISSNYTLILLFKDFENISDNSIKSLLNGTRSILINPIFYEILEVISHPIRKSIIKLLYIEKEMNFNKIFKQVKIEKSSLLAFHIKKLVKDSVITKNENLYTLTPRGQFISKLIDLVEEMGFSDPHSNVKIMKIISEEFN